MNPDFLGNILKSKLVFLILTLTLSLFTFTQSKAQKSPTVIDTYTYWSGNSSIGTKDTLTINDTLLVDGDLALGQGSVLNINEGAVCIIYGSLDFGTDGLLNIYANALCIIYGDFNLNNRVSLSIGAHLIVGGDLTTTASSNKIETTIDSTAAIYVLGEVDTAQIEGFNCPDPENYVPYTGATDCTYGDIISLEDNENDSTGIYDLFVSGDGNRGITPVYSELCFGETVTISALEENADWYQWCDSIGNAIAGENNYQFTVSEPGEYFVKIVTDFTIPDTTISYRAKVVGTSLEVDIVANNSPVCSGSAAEFTLAGTDGATVMYNINGGSNQSVVLQGGTVTISAFNVQTNQTLNVISAQTESANCDLNLNSSVTVNPLPTATISSTNGPVCEGEDASFTLNGTSSSAVTYNINGGGNETIILEGGSGVISFSNVTEDQTITLVSVSYGTCTTDLTETKTVAVNPLPATGDIIPD
ncbi:MAG TPA: hypothetical protein VEP89_08105 [Draconibacterium sp.]|nr:hypothetical protein [Draconibacterium sp.]